MKESIYKSCPYWDYKNKSLIKGCTIKSACRWMIENLGMPYRYKIEINGVFYPIWKLAYMQIEISKRVITDIDSGYRLNIVFVAE